MSILFIDTETTGLDPRNHVPWEVAIIEPDGTEHVWCWRPRRSELQDADHRALDIGGFYDRAPEVVEADAEASAAEEIATLTEGNVLAGSNPSFDTGMLRPWLRSWGYEPGWHYRTVCVATMAYGWIYGRETSGEWNHALPDLPWKSDDLSRACGVEPPTDDERHTVLGDARWVKRWHEALTGEAA